MFMYIPQLRHSGSRLDKLRKPNCHEAPPWLAQSGKFWTFCVSKLSQMAFSNSFLPLLLAPFIMICESMLYPWVRMDYYEKCWQYQNIDYRYFDYIYIYIWFQIYYPPLIKHWVWGDRFPLLSTPPAVTNLFSRAFQQLKSIGSGECNPLENV